MLDKKLNSEALATEYNSDQFTIKAFLYLEQLCTFYLSQSLNLPFKVDHKEAK